MQHCWVKVTEARENHLPLHGAVFLIGNGGTAQKRGGMNLSSASPAEGMHPSPCWRMANSQSQMEHHGVSLPCVGSAPALPQASAATWTKPAAQKCSVPIPSSSHSTFPWTRTGKGQKKGKKKQNRNSSPTRHLLFQGVMMWTVYSWDELCCNRGISRNWP